MVDITEKEGPKRKSSAPFGELNAYGLQVKKLKSDLDEVTLAEALYTYAIRLWEEYNAAQERPFKQREEATSQIGWIPPPRGWYKVNSDGAMFSKRRCSGIGVVIRDEQGRVVAAMSKNLQVPLGALEVEAKAVEEAVNFARDIGIQDIIVESDSMVFCSALQKEVDVSPAIDNIIAGTLLQLQYFRKTDVKHTRKEGNRVVHGLAQYAQFVDDFVTWMEETPPIIESEISSDVTQIDLS
ncbi:hypothetical protein SO802_000523 [Lithocarpus litseifolius]|uniref:RNase H type-1 domain-containing protein n=1 Tax=Lithocarpus litseifolius TaxID=425828 RepID=A0AAW2DTK8_9ROSI